MSAEGSVEPVVIRPGEGNRMAAGPLEMLIVEDGSHTSGSHAVIEFTLDGQFSPPMHVHHQHEEVIYVLEGEMALPFGDDEVRLGPGGAFVTPIGLPHTFKNGGTERLRFLLTVSPASHLAYFTSMADFLNGKMPADQTMQDVMLRYGLEPVQGT
jgi:mannose-6-phosphate isomerase-like protein (cupin superfamily)